jgi:hypothetical protein
MNGTYADFLKSFAYSWKDEDDIVKGEVVVNERLKV